MKPRVMPELQDWSGGFFHFVPAAESANSFSWVWSADVDPVSSGVPQTETFLIPGTQSAESQSGTVDDGGALVYGENHDGDFSYHVSDATPTADEARWHGTDGHFASHRALSSACHRWSAFGYQSCRSVYAGALE